MSSNEFSRRTFFKGAGIAALSAAALGGLAGCGNGYQATAPANTSAGETGSPSWLGTPPEVAAVPHRPQGSA